MVDRLSQDLRSAFPEMQGFSVRNLKYMRAFALGWPDLPFVQQVLHKLPWGHNLVLLDKLPGPQTRKWFLVPFHVIDEVVKHILDGSISDVIYEPETASLASANQ